jgi:DNA-binding NarL/FixJ family response regulator
LYDVRRVPRVLIASRDAAMGADLRGLLQTGGCTVVGEAAEDDAVLALAQNAAPDVVVALLPAEAADALRLVRRLRTTHPGTAVVGYSASSDGPDVLAAIDAGVRGYVLSDDDPVMVVSAVHAVLAGGAPLSAEAARALIDARSPPGPGSLTPREREVLGLLGEGMSNKEIAGRLGLSERTVKAHLTSAFRRLGVQRRTQAAMWVRARRDELRGG